MTYNSSKTGAQVDAAVEDVQEAKAASATDTTAGRLLKVRDFGVGATRLNDYEIPTLDADIIPTGFVGTSNGAAGNPDGNRQAVVNINWETGVNASKHQLAFSSPTSGGQEPIVSIRSRRLSLANGGTPWRYLYHTGNTIVDVNGFIKEA